MLSFKPVLRILALAFLSVGLSTALLLNGCEGSATQTTGGGGIENGLHGTLVDTQGRPVSGVEVHAWPASAGPNGLPNRPDVLKLALASTDSLGRYSLSNLEPGIYNVYGWQGQGDATVLIPRVKYLEKAQDLGTDTLVPPGTITGKVLSDGNPITPVFCYLQGSTYVALTDSTGAFALLRVPAGTYRLNYVAQGYASGTDTPIVVLSGKTLSLDPKDLPLDLDGQPPAPPILEAGYDTVQGVVNLRWRHVQVADRVGYHIESYREGQDSLALLARRFIKDSVFIDTVGQFFVSGFGSGKAEGFTQNYRVRAVDKEGNVSRLPATPIKLQVTRPEILKYSISFRVVEGDRDTTLCQDTLVFILDLDQPRKGPLQAHWSMTAWRPYPDGSLGTSLRDNRNHHSSDTLVWWWKKAWEGTVSPLPDSLRFEITTGPAGSSAQGDRREMNVRVTKEGCYAVRRSHPPIPVLDKYGNLIWPW